jgi:hypothetical protein
MIPAVAVILIAGLIVPALIMLIGIRIISTFMGVPSFGIGYADRFLIGEASTAIDVGCVTRLKRHASLLRHGVAGAVNIVSIQGSKRFSVCVFHATEQFAMFGGVWKVVTYLTK